MTLVSFLDSCNHVLTGPLASVLTLLWSALHAAIRAILGQEGLKKKKKKSLKSDQQKPDQSVQLPCPTSLFAPSSHSRRCSSTGLAQICRTPQSLSVCSSPAWNTLPLYTCTAHHSSLPSLLKCHLLRDTFHDQAVYKCLRTPALMPCSLSCSSSDTFP